MKKRIVILVMVDGAMMGENFLEIEDESQDDWTSEPIDKPTETS